MPRNERPIFYFDQAGYENTFDVVEIVSNRLKGRDIKSVVVASTRGETGLRFAKKMAKETNLVVVSSHPGYSAPGVWNFKPEILKKLDSLGCKVVKQSHILSGLERSFSNKFSGVSHTEVLAESLRCLFGVGMKVASPSKRRLPWEGPLQEEGQGLIAPLWSGLPTPTIFLTFGFLRF